MLLIYDWVDSSELDNAHDKLLLYRDRKIDISNTDFSDHYVFRRKLKADTLLLITQNRRFDPFLPCQLI